MLEWANKNQDSDHGLHFRPFEMFFYKKIIIRKSSQQFEEVHKNLKRYLISESNQDTSSGSLKLFVENWIQNWVVVFNILNQKWVTETKSCEQNDKGQIFVCLF